MMFPIIRHIDDVLPHVEGRPDFVIARKPGYTVIDYVYAASDTFDNPFRAECRGIKFDESGRLIARPFEKFFNVGEKPHTQAGVLDWSQPHVIMEKLDGSMIHPAIVNDEVVFMTRMGRTDVARKAERHMTPRLAREMKFILHMGLTPVFEFTAPDNRIVIDYAESEVTLLAARNTITGHYDNYIAIRGLGKYLDLPVVRDWTLPPDNVLEYARSVRGMEGFVVRFANGLAVKIKGEDYVLKHKAKESVLQEKNVLALVLKGAIDDVLPLLDAADRQRVEAYREDVLAGVDTLASKIDRLVRSGSHLDQKMFATEHLSDTTKEERTLAFQVRSGASPYKAAVDFLLGRTGSQSDVDKVRHLFRANFAAANDNTALRSAA